MKIAFTVIAVSILAGCSTAGPRASMTAGEIGCPPEEIKVSDGAMGWQTNTWTAECRGKTFYCTYTSSYNLSSRTQCREALPAQSAAK